MTTTADRSPGSQPDARQAELAANLRAVTARVEAAAADCARDPRDITVVAVTKTWPASDVRLLHGLGVRHAGENQDREAAAKAADCADLAEPLHWHFVGTLQRNKAASVARYADLVHSVDRPTLVAALSRAALAAGRTLPCLIQISLDADPRRGGVPTGELPLLAEALASAPGLELAGVMAVPPLGRSARASFERLRELSERLRADHPQATAISAGMSGDLEAAVAAGATHLRVGSALLGGRDYSVPASAPAPVPEMSA
ncbi:YggS family pyridoxal phosphate-dependent enzyme [Streptomyces sp. NPDC006487]|uniref:YggS family pyridoxal phosphate-dependent enzyme n=1 Tax=Streptomyces sp. NPDC006487 TaxID=3364748 RepID=UPI0036853052